MKIILAKNGLKRRKVEVSEIRVPDLWHIAHAQGNAEARDKILECWHLAHDLHAALTDIAVASDLAAIRKGDR